MPKEKTLFFIGIWIILLSNFIGLPTEIKNYLFIATALLLIVISYASNFSKINSEEIFFNRKVVVEKKTHIPLKEENIVYKSEPVTIIKKEKKIQQEAIKTLPDLENPFGDISRPSYEPVIKVRRARLRPKQKLIKEELPIESTFNLDSEEDDVVVISSDGDVSRES